MLFNSKQSLEGHFLPHLKLNGTEQMALDELLLDKSFDPASFSMACRFYSWEGSWLSIGRNQENIPISWENLLKKEKIKIVRRPSGGEAVLHSGGITYGLIWKNPPREKKQAYFQASNWIIKSFTELGLPLKFGQQKVNSFSLSGNCFSSKTTADLVDNYGNKIVGNAQRWKKGNVLQHGEILLNPPEKLWYDLFQTKPPQRISINLSSKEIEKVLKKNLFASWSNLIWKNRNLNEEEKEHIRINSKNYKFNSIS